MYGDEFDTYQWLNVEYISTKNRQLLEFYLNCANILSTGSQVIIATKFVFLRRIQPFSSKVLTEIKKRIKQTFR